MWVVLTGSPRPEAASTVMAAASATVKARTRSSLVIFWPTVRTSLGPNRMSPAAMPSAPTTITQVGTTTSVAMSPEDTALTTAASGPTALATSLEPWAKDRSAVEQMSGTVNRLLTDLRVFSSRAEARATSGLTKAKARAKAAMPIITITPAPGFHTCFSPFITRYIENTAAMMATKKGTQRRAAAILSSLKMIRNLMPARKSEATTAPNTGEITQLAAIAAIVGQFTAVAPAAATPAPSTPPTMAWVVETGAPM